MDYFSDILVAHGYALQDVALCLHKPSDPVSRNGLLALAEENETLFEAYQSTHPKIQEATLKRRPFIASFVMTMPGELTFVGLYHVECLGSQSAAQLLNDHNFTEMLRRIDGHKIDVGRQAAHLGGRERFAFSKIDSLAHLKGRLVVQDAGGRNYVRLAETTSLQILEIKRKPTLAPPFPSWRNLTLSKQELMSLPREWEIALSHLSGIYLITDMFDGAPYVGAAYGAENFFGRWRVHVSGDKGITAKLALRNTANFRFSILELLNISTPIEEVTGREQSWMRRLHSKEIGLNS